MAKTRMIMMLGIVCVGILVLAGCQNIADNPVANTSSNSVNIPRINLIVGGSFIFGEWRPPISLASSFTPGQQVPIKFTVLDQNGNPAITGVEATIIIGDTQSDPAVIDDSTTGQWVTHVTLPGVGTYDVVLIGNVMNVTPLTITVEVAVPQGNTDSTTSGTGCGGCCDHHNNDGTCGSWGSNGGNGCGGDSDHNNDGGNCGGWGKSNSGNWGSWGNSNSGYGNNSNGGNCGGWGNSNSGYGSGWGKSNSGNCGNQGNSNNGYGNNSNGGNCGNRGNTNNGYGNNSNGGNCGNKGNSNNGYGNNSSGGNCGNRDNGYGNNGSNGCR